MTVLIIGLFAYAAAAAVLGARLTRACRRWQRDSPRLGLVFWTALTTSWIAAVLSGGLAATAQLSGGFGLAALLRACLRAIRTIVGVHDPAEAPAAIALIGSLLVILRLCAVALRLTWTTRRHRGTHRHAVCAPAGTYRHNGRHVTLVEAPELTAYCLPGRHSGIVLSTGTVEQLSRAELDAVIAHEHAHLNGKHHLCLQWATILAQAFPFVPLLRAASHEITRLVEWIADDHAGQRHGTRTVAQALAVMAANIRTSGPTADEAMTVTGSDVPERVKRLLRPQPMRNPARRRITAALAVPVLALLAAAAVLVPHAAADPTPLCAPPTSATGPPDDLPRDCLTRLWPQ